MKHTPGPWEVVGTSVYGNGLRACLPMNGADARLMAAAPEMYEALLAALNVLHPDFPEYMAAKNAIAKATGEMR